MSDADAKPASFVRLVGPALILACCIPILLLSLAYLEHVAFGTHRIKEALHVDQILHGLEGFFRLR